MVVFILREYTDPLYAFNEQLEQGVFEPPRAQPRLPQTHRCESRCWEMCRNFGLVLRGRGTVGWTTEVIRE
jgi:hypothetical protein